MRESVLKLIGASIYEIYISAEYNNYYIPNSPYWKLLIKESKHENKKTYAILNDYDQIFQEEEFERIIDLKNFW